MLWLTSDSVVDLLSHVRQISPKVEANFVVFSSNNANFTNVSVVAWLLVLRELNLATVVRLRCSTQVL